MQYLYLIMSIFCSASTKIIASLFNRKNAKRTGVSPIYNLYLMLSVSTCWLIMFMTDRTYDLSVLPYAFLFSLFYTIYSIGIINAMKLGSVMLTSLFLQLSMILVSIWGFFFWNAQFTWTIGIGLVLAVIALWLCLNNGSSKDAVKINFKWIRYVFLLVIGNAGCSVIQRTQQINFSGKYGNFLMLVATGISTLVCLVLYLRSDRQDSAVITRSSWYLPVLAGVLNALLNLSLILMATSDLSPSLIYPVLAIGSLIIITILSLLVFKEKMRWWQWLGVLSGIAATGILSI